MEYLLSISSWSCLVHHLGWTRDRSFYGARAFAIFIGLGPKELDASVAWGHQFAVFCFPCARKWFFSTVEMGFEFFPWLLMLCSVRTVPISGYKKTTAHHHLAMITSSANQNWALKMGCVTFLLMSHPWFRYLRKSIFKIRLVLALVTACKNGWSSFVDRTTSLFKLSWIQYIIAVVNVNGWFLLADNLLHNRMALGHFFSISNFLSCSVSVHMDKTSPSSTQHSTRNTYSVLNTN